MQSRRNAEPARAAADEPSTNSKPSLAGRGPVSSAFNLWGLAGRQETMEMRRLWQLRIPRSRHPKSIDS